MVYTKTTWIDGVTPASASNLNNIENGLASLDTNKANVSDAVPLSIKTPVIGTTNGTAGVAAIAAREDHSHPLLSAVGYPIAPVGSGRMAMPVGRPSPWNPPGLDNKGLVSPLPVYRSYRLTDLSMFLIAAADAGTFSLAIYAFDLTGAASGSPLWTSAQTTATDGGPGVRKIFTGINLNLTPGIYGVCFGAKGYTTNRPKPCAVNTDVWQNTLLATYEGQFYASSPFISNYDETTGVWPANPSMSYGNDGSAWSYSVNGDFLNVV